MYLCIFFNMHRCIITYSEHPCRVFHFVRVGLHVAVVKGAAFMQVHLVVVDEMRDEHRNVACDQAL